MIITKISKPKRITNTYFDKSILSVDCGEIFMGEYDACRLISVNLFSFVGNPFTEKAYFDYKKFYEVSYETMRLGDNLIDLEARYIQRIIDKVKSDPEPEYVKVNEIKLWENLKTTALSSRRAGIGFTALGDMFAALGLKYDSQEALQVTEAVMKTKMEAELDCTIDLGIMRGTFKYCDPKIEKNIFYEFIEENFPDQWRRMQQFGRRNVSWSTCAPVGTVSILAGTTSGIEPLFMPFYKRRRKINPSEQNARVDFVDDLGDSWQEYFVLHPKFKQWIEINYPESDLSKTIVLEELFKKSPWFESTANDINWIRRVELQGMIGQYISHSISSCITEDSLISTDKGLFYFDELEKLKNIPENEFIKNNNYDKKILNHNGDFVNITSFYNNGIKPVFLMKLSNGLFIKCTDNEKFIKFDDEDDIENWVELKYLQEGDLIKLKNI